MKKILLLLSLALLLNFNSFGQDYTLTKNLPLAQISGTPNIVTIGPETSSPALPVGFDFNFYGNSYNQFYINPSGTISFGAPGNYFVLGGSPLPNVNMTPNIIGFSIYTAPTDIINGQYVARYANFTNQDINYFVSGSAPNRVLVVNYKNIVLPSFYAISTPNTINVQIQLYEGAEGKIEIHSINNRAELTDYGTGSFGQVGLQNSNSTKGTVVENSNFSSKNWDLSGTMVRLVYNAAPPPTITIDNTTPTQICGAAGSSFVVNFTKTGSFANPSTKVSLYERRNFEGINIYTNELRLTHTNTNSATLNLTTNLESSHGGGNPTLTYFISVSNGSVAVEYPVTVSSPPTPNITLTGTLPITTLGQAVVLNTSPLANITKQWYKSTPVYFQTDRPIGIELPGQNGDNLTIVPEETAYYSVKYVDQSGCNSVSAIKRVAINFSLSGTSTAADNTYTEGPLEFGIYSNCGGGTAVQLPTNQYTGNLYDADTHYYAFLGSNDGCYGFNAHFIYRKANIWGVYFMTKTSTNGGSQTNWTRLFHTKDPFPTISGARLSATSLTNTVPPTSAVWINDGTGEEVTLSLNGATEQPLPITLISFAGKATEKGNRLTWKTANEKAFSHFEIQKSIDAKKFEKIGEVKGNNVEVYEFIDQISNANQSTPPSGVGGLYRLKMIDLDGSFSYSKIIHIENNFEETVVGNIYPNPAISNEIYIDIQAVEAGDWTINNYEITGKLINTETKYLQKGINKVKVNIEKGGIGNIYMQLESNGILEIRKIIKK